MQKITLLLLLSTCFALSVKPQTVETLETSSPTSCDDMYVDADGIIYTGKGGLSNKTNLGRVTPNGDVTSVAQGMKGPISIVEAPDGLLYVTNYDDNTIKSYNRATEEVVTVATGMDGPSGIAVDSSGVVYATNWGGAPNYNGQEIHRLFPDGTFEVFKFSSQFSRLQGIAFDDEGWLYVANTQNGRVFKLNTETAEMETLVTMNQNVVNMEFHDGYFYMASIQSNKIYRMDLNGEWSTFAGTGTSGGMDGPVESATFNNPIGIGFSHSGDTLYVADSPNRLRRIVFEETPSNSIEHDLIGNISVSPNPSSGIFKVDLSDKIYNGAEIKVVDVMGEIIFHEKINRSDLTIDLSDEMEGHYFLILQYGEYIRAVKLRLAR